MPYVDTPVNSSSILDNLLYFAVLSLLHGAPVFICPELQATAISAIVVSSLSLVSVLSLLSLLSLAVDTFNSSCLSPFNSLLLLFYKW